jgi:SAM-dependent methyltransferase
MTSLKSLARPLHRLLKKDALEVDGSTIPIADMRFGGAHFKNNTDFLQTAEMEAKRLVENCGITEEGAVLDIGCGTGRLAIGLLRTLGDAVQYRGVDVSEPAIAWCRRYIEKQHPNYRFIHINIENERYNPHGKRIDTTFHLPLADATFDAIYLYSVFSHMELQDVKMYLNEFRRLLKPTGTIFLTTFVEENVPEFEVNPKDYRTDWQGALHCVRFEKNFFQKLVEEHGLVMKNFEYEKETDGQSGIYLIANC